MSKGDRENTKTETKGCVLDTHFSDETHFVYNQISLNRKTAHLQRLACISITGSMHSTPTAALQVILMLPPLGIYIEGKARQATIFGHLEVFEKITNEGPSLLTPGHKIIPIISFGRRFLVELPLRSSWLSQETLEILP
jgi:hypothetical protein